MEVFNTTDMIKEIIHYIDDESTVGLLCLNKASFSLVKFYEKRIFRYAISRELKYVGKLEIGSRVYTEEGINYKIIEINKVYGKITKVDAFGNKIENDLMDIRYYPDMKCWRTVEGVRGGFQLKSGILLFESGPLISGMDSIYVLYETLRRGEDPKLNILIRIKQTKTVNYQTRMQINENWRRIYFYFDYLITDLSDDQMKLIISVTKVTYRTVVNETPEFYLVANKIDNKWIITDKNYNISYDYSDQY